ncbi:MAG TPA: HAD-IC family P-type ATPase, partial [Myxococcota bacterium]|nr:HAD-IC family P-type ATPase [Myxococcota bacterium]
MRRRIPEDRVEGLLGSLRGLTGDEVRVRRLRHGANDVIEDSRGEAFELLRETVRDPMIGFLIGTGVLYALIGERPEAITLLVSILPLAGMDAYLHRRTRVATAGLRSRLSPRVTVDRDARTVEVPAIELVPGDLAIVSAGDTFPADGVIEAGVDLQVDEAMLTGEANPARKQALRPAASLGGQGGAVDERHWGFAGTRILTGRAQVRVVNTGAETLYGEIVRSARSGARSATPLQREVGRLVAALVIAASALCVFVGAVRLIQGYGWFDALLSAITLAVAALPEEFPIVFTVFLGVGVLRLARRGALVRRAVCVESIGRVSCICADKTGTLTLGELHLTHRIPIEGVTEDQLLETAARASRAGSGDALDVAIERAMRAHSLCGADTEILATFPFTEERRRETVVELDDGGRLQVAVKGAPEVVLSACDLSPAARRDWLAQVDSLAREGHKLIAVAEGARPRSAWTGEEPAEGLRFVGMIACEDPVRAGHG